MVGDKENTLFLPDYVKKNKGTGDSRTQRFSYSPVACCKPARCHDVLSGVLFVIPSFMVRSFSRIMRD
jgi:hypothetical protein